MNRDVLTVLGCSSSIALMLLTVSPAHASTTAPQDGSAGSPPAIAIEIETVGTPLSQSHTQPPSLDISSDRVGNLAILKLGYDCWFVRFISTKKPGFWPGRA